MSPKAIFTTVTAAILCLLFVRRLPFGFRFTSCLVFAVICSLFGLTGSLAPHRLAQLQLAKEGQLPSADWLNGAMATRDAMHPVILFWLVAVALLAVLSIYTAYQIKPGDSHPRSPGAQP